MPSWYLLLFNYLTLIIIMIIITDYLFIYYMLSLKCNIQQNCIDITKSSKVTKINRIIEQIVKYNKIT